MDHNGNTFLLNEGSVTPSWFLTFFNFILCLILLPEQRNRGLFHFFTFNYHFPPKADGRTLSEWPNYKTFLRIDWTWKILLRNCLALVNITGKYIFKFRTDLSWWPVETSQIQNSDRLIETDTFTGRYQCQLIPS